MNFDAFSAALYFALSAPEDRFVVYRIYGTTDAPQLGCRVAWLGAREEVPLDATGCETYADLLAFVRHNASDGVRLGVTGTLIDEIAGTTTTYAPEAA